VSESRHISQSIARSADDVYEYASDPTNLPEWASGLGSSVEHLDGRWFVESPGGRLTVAFAARNDFGILDHEVTLPSGETVYNPMRVIADGDGYEVVFTLRRQPGMTEADFSRDADLVLADLGALKSRDPWWQRGTPRRSASALATCDSRRATPAICATWTTTASTWWSASSGRCSLPGPMP
jgi:hypothetical protein